MKRNIGFIFLVLTFAAAVTAGEEKLAGGPYAIDVTDRTATLAWVMEGAGAMLSAADGKPVKSSPVLRAERTKLTGLAPGTTYTYQVPGHPEAKGTFKTAPAAGAPFQFVVYGDTRTRHDVHRKVVAAILKYASPDFIVQTGDMVENGADSSLWPIFFDIENPLLRKGGYFPLVGNHERNDSYYYQFFGSRPYYSFNWGDAHFTVMNSDLASVAPDPAARDAFWKAQMSWLEDDMARNQKAGFRFLVAHHPPMTAVARRHEDNPHMQALVPVFEKYKVTAAMFGHDHNYQHYLKNGVHYFISGGGGAPLYDVSEPPAGITQKVASTENFMVFKVNGKTLRIEAVDANGEMIDITTIAR